MAEIKDYSVTADDNNSASPNGMPENMAPSGVNNSWRESFARVKRWYEDINATKSTTGSSNAYVLAAARTVTAYAQGDAYMFRANHANTGAATLNIDSVGAVAIVNNTQSALAAGQIQAGGIYLVAYDATNSKFQLVGASATSASGDNIFVFNASPSVTLENSTAEDSDGGRESTIQWKGLQSGSEESTLVKIIGSHDGSSDDQKGKLQIYTNDGSDGDSPTLQVTIDSAGLCTLVGAASVGGALTVAGATQLNSTVTVGADDQGYDVILYGDTASANVTWDTSADDLILNGAAGLIVPDGQLTLAATAITSTGSELNYNDTGAVVGTVVASKTVTVDANKDVSSFRNITLTGELNAGSLATSGVVNLNLVTDSTSSTSGALIIDGGVGIAKKLFVGTDFDVSANAVIDGTALVTGVLTTTATQVATGGITSGSDIVSDTDSTDDLGTTGVRWANLFVDAITATDQITATGFTGTLDGILGSGAAAAATTTTLNTSGTVVHNEAGAAVDFRVEGDTDPYLIFADGDVDRVAIGGSDTLLFNAAGTNAKLVVIGNSSNTSVVQNGNAALAIVNTDQTDENTAGLHFARADTDDTPNYAGASIVAQFKETQATGQYPSATLNFLTSTTQNAAPSVKMTLSEAGNLNVTGALSKGSGSFKIDHPLESKKDTHYLAHSFVEGAQADNIYRGKIDLVSGTATVNIDTVSNMTEGTFVALNREIQCFTTNETGWTAVKGSVSGNVLTIIAQDNTCTDRISWMVIGERQDQHMYEADWTDSDGKVITEPLKKDVK
tara:strand:+ start:753 stop:3116 length:2364 start_codon:yes stop_codon:yes gene_type:complete